MRKKPENFTAYDYTLRALHIINSLDKDTFMQAREYLQKAMQEDPEFAMPAAWAPLAGTVYMSVRDGRPIRRQIAPRRWSSLEKR